MLPSTVHGLSLIGFNEDENGVNHMLQPSQSTDLNLAKYLQEFLDQNATHSLP